MTYPAGTRILFLALSGSRAHGTASESSDADVRGVCAMPLAARLDLFATFEQIEGKLPPETSSTARARLDEIGAITECVIFDVAKFVRLCMEANPNALEILFTDQRDWLEQSPQWLQLWNMRHRFLTTKIAQTFLGYAMGQLRRIKTHRSWLLSPPKQQPLRSEFGLPDTNGMLSRDDINRVEESIAEKLRSYELGAIELEAATREVIEHRIKTLCSDMLACDRDEIDERLRAIASISLGIPRDVMTTLNAEKRYRSAMKHWESFQAWKSQRNRARADLEAKHGYDTKHAVHLVRLLRMGVEALEQGDLMVRRNDAAELRAIRDGAWTFDQVIEHAAHLSSLTGQRLATSQLPHHVDGAAASSLATAIMLQCS